jgi:hypothetical protein
MQIDVTGIPTPCCWRISRQPYTPMEVQIERLGKPVTAVINERRNKEVAQTKNLAPKEHGTSGMKP